VQKDAKVEVLDVIMSLIEQNWASKVGRTELGKQRRASGVPLVHMVAKVPIL
jgi:hypothetical protein